MMEPYSDRPKSADLLELQRRVLRISFQQNKCFVRQYLNVDSEATIASPEVGGGMVYHNTVERPAL